MGLSYSEKALPSNAGLKPAGLYKLTPPVLTEEGSFISATRFSLWNDWLSHVGASLSRTDASGYGVSRGDQSGGTDGAMPADSALALMEGGTVGQCGHYAAGIPSGATIQPALSDMGLPAASAECTGAGLSAVFGGMVGDQRGGAGGDEEKEQGDKGVTRRLRRGSRACGPMGSVSEGFQRASGKPFGAPQAHIPCPGWGLTRRLRRRSRACGPMGRSHFSFDGERKVCKRKPAARRLREKALYCPF